MILLPGQTTDSATSLALKEWSGVVEGLLAGESLVLLRKGGIAEKGFACPGGPCWLFPTWSHQQEQGLNNRGARFIRPCPLADTVRIAGWATMEATWTMLDPALLPPLEPWHLLTRASVEKRFQYRHPALTVLLLRPYLLEQPVTLPADPAWDGCHSWLHLQAPLPLQPAHFVGPDCGGLRKALEGILGPSDKIKPPGA